jgi:type II secretory ATPase GspE/PulE/Tfp pilus assembly ATPase PilB-like protein
VLRQDPDIVLVGEIRDGETADIAVKAALTGHLVLSTLHTNDAVGVVARLFDMQIAPFMLASSLILAQAQRLFRKLCPFCKKPVEINAELLRANKVDPAPFEGVTVYGPGGCPKCRGSGYKGRGAFMEVLPISPKIRGLIERGGDAEKLKAYALEEGMVTLKEAGMRKVRAGITSLEAAFEVTGGE